MDVSGLKRKEQVSTLSRPKAAGLQGNRLCLPTTGFNTQPPEGGWDRKEYTVQIGACFNTQPPEGGWPPSPPSSMRPICFNTQPPEGGWKFFISQAEALFCFNTQPPEGGWKSCIIPPFVLVCFNTQPPEGGWACGKTKLYAMIKFQHSAARRRLGLKRQRCLTLCWVSTLSRPKAAGFIGQQLYGGAPSFNTQPPEGGWENPSRFAFRPIGFQHSAARRRLAAGIHYCNGALQFQHSAARRRLVGKNFNFSDCGRVSTLSRPKAAGSSVRFGRR